MTYNPNYIEVTPPDFVVFEDAPNKNSISYVSIKNLTSKRVAYKIKTTSPKGYVVKPNSGIILPNETKRIEFNMQPTSYVPSTKNNMDKFMFMAIDLADNFETSKLAEVWKDKPQEAIQQLKLQASFKGSISQSQPLGERRSEGVRNNYEEEDVRDSGERMVRASMPMGQRTNANNQVFTSIISTGIGNNNNYPEDSDYLLNKVQEQEKTITRLTEERNQFFNEVVSLKELLEKTKNPKNKGNYSSFQLWHVLVAVIISLLIGAFLSS